MKLINSAAADASVETERALIERILAGEHAAFCELIRPYQRNLYLTAYSFLQNPTEAEDAAQDAVVKAFRHLKSFRGEARFSTWLLRIVMNEARMRLRHSRRFQSLDALQDDSDEGDYCPALLADWREIPSDLVEKAEIRDEIERALSQLPPNMRAVLLARDVQQLSTAETAVALDISPALVKVRLHRARLKLRDLLAPRLQRAVGGAKTKQARRKLWF